ncbi:MAG: transporter ATP-binding protein [Clostridia bacterium]|nr:transporter ATP-binding protein [Clostridia bacterium]
MKEKIIEVKNLKKTYGDIQAVKGIDFYVEKGALFAFLGTNGAGKSTTIDIISTLLKADSGEVVIDGNILGKDDEKIRASIGIVFQESVLDTLLTVKENLSLRGRFYNLSKQALDKSMEKAIEVTDIASILSQPYGKLSGGQRRRTDIARALINTPKILFLDEPTTGLDPKTRKNVWDTIQKLQKENGMTVFMTTHYMEEAANADYIIIIEKGEILAKGTPDELKDNFSTDVLKIKPKTEKVLNDLLNKENIEFKISGGIYNILLKNTVDALPIIEKCKDNIENLQILNGTMDDVFINLTGRDIELTEKEGINNDNNSNKKSKAVLPR